MNINFEFAEDIHVFQNFKKIIWNKYFLGTYSGE